MQWRRDREKFEQLYTFDAFREGLPRCYRFGYCRNEERRTMCGSPD